MKISEVKIHNFRGIYEQSIVLNPYTIFVGTNNSGKTTFIDAIRAFYEKDYKFSQQDLSLVHKDEKESWIEILFSLSHSEQEVLKAEYLLDNGTLKVRKFFATESADWKPNFVYAYTTDGSLSRSVFYGWKGVQQGKFGSVIYIPAVSKVEDHTKLTGASALRDILMNLMTTVAKNSTAYSAFKESVETFADGIKSLKSNQENQLYNFERDFTEKLQNWNTKFELNINPPTIETIVKNMVGFDLIDLNLNEQQDISAYGSGFQRHFIFSLLELSAKFEPVKETKKETFQPEMTLILFEEPEAFLHPSQQESLAKSLEKMAAGENTQIICTSHSPFLLSRKANAMFSLVKVQRRQGEVEYRQITNSVWDEIAQYNLDSTAEIGSSSRNELRTEEMEAMRYFILFNPDRLNIFFAEHVLFVEGVSEIALINKLICDGKLDIPCGCYILDSMGKFNMPKFMKLCKTLGIYHSVLYDKDSGRNNQDDWNQLIINTKNEFTFATTELKHDLESFLELQSIPGNEKSFKPQILLHKYVQGEISEERIAAFCDCIHGLVTR